MLNTLRKYLALFRSFFRASMIADLEYRLNYVMKIWTDILWYTAQLSVFEILFRHTQAISGWTIDTTRVFMGVLFVMDAFWMLLFSENLDRLSDKVRKGDLDLLLSKPVNSQFMMSMQKVNTAYMTNILVTSGYLIWALTQLPNGFVWPRLLLMFILIPCSLTTIYSIRFMFSATALIFQRAENITYIWFQLYRLGMRPDSVYPPWLRYLILSIIPLGFLASVPSRLILETPDLLLLGAAILVAAIALMVAKRFWRYALTKYSSASS